MRSRRTVVFPSGATRSECKPAYHLIPPAAQRRGAIRFAEGSAEHGAENWKKAVDDPEWIAQAFNHAIEHLLDFSENGLPYLIQGKPSHEHDDNLAAARFGLDVLMHFQEVINARRHRRMPTPEFKK